MGKNNKKKQKKDDLTIMRDSINRVLKMRRAEKNEIETILTIMKRFSNDRSIKQTLANHEKATEQLQEAKDLITSVRRLLSRR
jgi:hypothetical protein